MISAFSKRLPLHLSRSLICVVFFAGALAGKVVSAAEPKPDAALKNKAIDASVFLDPRIKADPALAADSLAEGKKWIDKNAA